MTKNTTKNLILDHDACYAAMRSHDARFDGRFFCGVSSTRIYCRPVCRVKVPKQENCTFFASAAAAEAAGYRPCLRCRPELAPGLAAADAVTRLASTAARRMEEDGLSDTTIAELGNELHISDRQLRRAFMTEYGVSPVQYLQTRRLLLAKSLLADTRLPITEVAMSAGFGSIRRFNDLFGKRYRMAPSRFREKESAAGADGDAITLYLGYRPPYAWDEILSFLAARAIPGVESATPDAYRRTVAMKRADKVHEGWISVSHAPKRNALAVTIASPLLPVLPQVLTRVRQLFDLDCEPVSVQEKLATMAAISPLLPVPGLRLPGSFDPFESCTRAVLGQQVTVKAARTLAARFAEALGDKVVTPYRELTTTFPIADRLCNVEGTVEDRLGPLGIIGARARSLQALAKALVAGDITLTSPADPEQETAKLLKLPGFGPWTVQYISMRVLRWPDILLTGDFGVKKALAALPPEEAEQLAEGWSPWRSYATVSLWHALANGD